MSVPYCGQFARHICIYIFEIYKFYILFFFFFVFFVGILFDIYFLLCGILSVFAYFTHFDQFWVSGANNTRISDTSTTHAERIQYFFLNEREREIEKNIVLFWLNIHKNKHIMLKRNTCHKREKKWNEKQNTKILHILIYVYILYIYIRSK